jgi:hypothetical protein
MPDQKHHHAALSVESVGMTDDDRDVVERTLNKQGKLMFHVQSRNKMSECNVLESKETEFSESKNAKIAGENNIVILYNKGIIRHEFIS